MLFSQPCGVVSLTSRMMLPSLLSRYKRLRAQMVRKWSETVLFSSRRVGTGDVHYRQYRAETLGEIILSSAKSLHQQK